MYYKDTNTSDVMVVVKFICRILRVLQRYQH